MMKQFRVNIQDVQQHLALFRLMSWFGPFLTIFGFSCDITFIFIEDITKYSWVIILGILCSAIGLLITCASISSCCKFESTRYFMCPCCLSQSELQDIHLHVQSFDAQDQEVI
ncbi:Hypothetical_protein [Hexamita inflata]|uniref:Hypothetical_protein n=1 Tax=Hexamita inflata TaxID=28002 RepID=A0AA86PM32_9EUKA|nr:Hypothetical protein HINF_LOCUS27494 [Hexamita inflata]CAI9942630.1 Hypothetical protein HINF_LOCUS30275 [Hexamita inflata]CAI9961856.1 Hypothetical protein HINF_LOCUS49501 [Hexamita inflata]